ncbi:non-ribosomal peptide synthetase [Brenneria goodwinii]|uniref:Non-ribosomal peptide synthetase n=2 Tax=Brenneria goodwinii TaxID=1109412 RepID=A0AAE8EPM0_9GAMM|nr:non-ribosomal peptide synthetase [Brenneria goodwinii]ATA25111.1 non-ribosomal peptide synthetase [Brenneria goodwinii]RLM25818.1 non-ribosomal peptide synthetase [Brenneria goodwinii]
MMTKTNSAELKSLSLAELKKIAREKKKPTVAAPGAIIKQSAESARRNFPVTGSQKSIWVLDQYLDDGKAYNNPYAITCRFENDIDTEVVKKTLRHLTKKHSILRTSFNVVEGEVCQCVSDEPLFNFQYDDMSSLPEDERDEWVETVAREEGLRHFDLTRGPLFYWRMIKTHHHEYVLLLTFHHIISDGWTVSLFFKEFMETYFRLLHGETLQTEGFLQFSDYALAQEQWYATDEYQQGLAHWAKKLDGVQGVLEIETDRPRPPKMSTRGGMVSRHYDHNLTQRLQMGAAQLGATPFHMIMAAYTLLLHKYSGQQQIIIGAPFANRNQPETQNLMGLFMNTLPLRFEVSPQATLREIVDSAREESEQAQHYQAIPLNDILEKITYIRNPQINPLFQAALTYQVFPHFHNNRLFTYQLLKVDYGVSKLDLNLWVEETDSGLMLTMNYNSDLFNRSTITRMLSDFCSALDAFVEQPQLAVRDFSLVSRAERLQLLNGCRRTPDTAPMAVHRQFERQVEASAPGALAVRCAGRALSYQQLNEQANCLANRLLENGLLPGQSVALYMAKSELCVVALLAVLKAGGCYVPIDIALPAEQVDFILQDAAVRLVLVDSDSPEISRTTISVDQLDGSLSGDDPQLSTMAADAPAYIIYTSGSTGRPKGVRVNHEQLSRYCQAIAPVLDQPAGARYGMFSAFTTDLAHTMLFPALINRGQLEVISTQQLNDPQTLFSYLEDNPLDCMKITPTHLAALLISPQAGALLPRNLLVLGGERAPVSLIKRIRQLGATCRVVNHYGPTECTVGVATYTVPDSLIDASDYLPVGKPLADSHVLILDAYQQLVPIGQPGEICLGGGHLAAGYIGLAEQNRAHFIPHPYLAGERIYRTGDKGRWLPDGNLEFLGRLDRQVKVRGYRVELAEIENVLQQQPAIVQAAVKQWQLGEGENRLVAYCCGQEKACEGEVQAFLKSKLPHYMQPDQWVWLASLPLTASGKVDYAALPFTDDTTLQAIQQPEGDMERRLHDIYCRVLQREQVDTRDDFFNLGGNSITALKLVIEINQQFGTSLSIGQLFEHSSVSQLATVLAQAEPQKSLSLVMLNPGLAQSKPTLLMIHPAGGNILCYYPLTNELGAEYPVYGLQVANFSEDQDYNHHIETLAAFYLRQVPEIAQRQNLVLGGWSLGATIAFEMAQQLQRAGGRAPTVLILDQPAPLVQVDHAAEMDEYQRLAYFARKVERFTGTSFAIAAPALAEMTPAQRSALFLQEFKRAKLVPDNIDIAHFQHFLTILQAHISATDRYQGKEYAGNIVVVEAEEILPDRIRPDAPALGWARLAGGSLTVIPTPGNHISMMSMPLISHTASQLRKVLL